MKNTINVEGYNICMVSLDDWTFDDNCGDVFRGTFAKVMIYAIVRHGFLIKDLEKGVEMALGENNDSIHFGTYKTPIYSFKKVKAA